MHKQLTLDLHKGSRGGRRIGSGRKRIHSKGVAHLSRENVSGRTPMHINFKYRTHIRNKECLKLLKRAIINARKHGLRILHYSMQSNHLHFIIEAGSNETLSRGMRSLTITFAKGLRKGKVQLGRYHLHVLRSIRETRNAIEYVLFNQQKHEKGTCSNIDQYSSVLSLKNVSKVIAQYAKNKKMFLWIRRKPGLDMDVGTSYIFRLGQSRLIV